MSFGQILRTAREAKGLTASELAARTHLLVQIVEGLENEDFRRIPAPIYGRGFVKLYCETVGIDPKPLQAEFMSLYALGKNAPATAGRVTPPQTAKPPPSVIEPEPPPVIEPSPAVELEPSPAVEHEAQVAPQTVISEPPPPAIGTPRAIKPELPLTVEQAPAVELTTQMTPQEVISEPPPRRSYGELFEQAYAQPEPSKPSAADKFRDTMSNVSHGVFANVKKLPPNTGRMITVSIAVLLLLALIGWGVAALYKATTPQPSPDKPQVPAITPTKPSATPAKSTSSTKPETTPTKPISPTKRAAASGGSKTTDVRPEELKASGIQVPPLYID